MFRKHSHFHLDIVCGTLYNEIANYSIRGAAMDKIEIISGFMGELRRGTIILCVLVNLREPTYGYGLIETLSKTGMAIEANTLYPLLRRLEGQGLLHSSWNTEGAKPRKYYDLTGFGKEVLAELSKCWRENVQSMESMLGESVNE
jgi:DNA-binding PadR family transcriptional regulator